MKKNILILNILLFLAIGVQAQSTSNYIVTDQFGYLPESEKIATIRNPITGPDANESFTPGNNYAVINTTTNNQAYNGVIEIWKNGLEDPSSGDKAWHFNFSQLTTPGIYYILDIDNNVKSHSFEINESVYQELLKQAVRTFFYQRSGYEKEATYAGNWADGASHIGPLQDKNCRAYDHPNDASSELDVHGGWYDAGDYNKYTSWTADYVIEFAKAYEEAPEVWSDDYNLPESGNGIPDIIDEMDWGLKHLQRLQKPDGAIISIVDADHATPPSSATAPSLYGAVNTSATLAAGGAFAKAAILYQSIGRWQEATILIDQATKAWTWANNNPNIIWENNSDAYNSRGIGSGQQETNDYGRFVYKLQLAAFLYQLTNESVYKDFFENNYDDLNLFKWNFAYPFESKEQDIALYYTTIPSASTAVKNNILTTYKNAMVNGSENIPAHDNIKDPYLGHIKDYTWGVNRNKCQVGLMFTNLMNFNIDQSLNTKAKKYAERYIHNLHGVNPLSKVYLSNMESFGAENSVTQFYHTWFHEGDPKYDEVGVSAFGPAPGFLVGGPNPSYSLDDCCPNGCGSTTNNAKCTEVDMTDVINQPNQKSYKDVNNTWPINSWELTENSNSYQLSYIRLLSQYAQKKYDCSGELNGTASFDQCNICSGGNTGIIPITNPNNCNPITEVFSSPESNNNTLSIHPNPGKDLINISGINKDSEWAIFDIKGQKILSGNKKKINIKNLSKGVYILKSETQATKLIVE